MAARLRHHHGMSAADIEIERALGAAIARVRGISGLREEHVVASLFAHGLGPLRVDLNRLFGGGVSLNGLFCHGRPQVRWNGSRCELGDLLVVVEHRGPRRVLKALLIQMKIADKTAVPKEQDELYRVWPVFEYVARGAAHSRDVEPKHPHDGAQFGMIDLDAATVAMQREVATGPHQAMAFEVGQMLSTPHRGGRRFATRAADDDSDWSQVIWDLLRTTFSRADFTLRKAGEVGTPRLLDPHDVVLLADVSGMPPAVAERVGPLADRVWQETMRRAGGEDGAPRWIDDVAELSGRQDFDDDGPRSPPDGLGPDGPGGMPTLIIGVDWR
jgi:hypothetical protein